MGRASGRASRRPPRQGEQLTEDEREDIGQSPRQDPAGSPIPGLTGNILNYETPRQEVPVPAPREQNAGFMAHGVPPGEDTTEERAQWMRGAPNADRPRFGKVEGVLQRPVPVPVYITEPAGGARPLRTIATNKFTIAANGQGATRISSRDESRLTMYVQYESPSIAAAGISSVTAPAVPSNPTPTQPAIPASTVAVQNLNAYPVTVVISAGTITAVVVNGITVGTAAGTYTVPANGAISITYSVAPTWTWSYGGPGIAAVNGNSFPVSVVITAAGATITGVSVNGVVIGTAAGTYTVPAGGEISIAYTGGPPPWTWSTLVPAGIRIDHEEATLDVGLGALLKPGSGYLEIKGCQDELFAVSADSTTPVLDIIYVYELAGAL